jgi:ketosteroid isomerase-like protein
VLPGAVFIDNDGSVLRGRDAIVHGWSAIIRGDGVKLDWRPSSVVLTADARIAVSRGPYWVTITKGDAPRFAAGTFQSIWVKDRDGAWRVAVDGGTAPPKPVTEDEARRLSTEPAPRCKGGT